ncbi:heterodisulfide reductase subunit E, partial [Candidatus Magnetoovum chiemensis]
MGDETIFKPDLDFVRGLKDGGAENLKKCYQCATCSVVCQLSTDERPFPRKEMILAQWGIKDQLAKDPNVWLCHNCNDCSKYCPRDARPGDVLSVLRKTAIEENAFPSFMAKIAGEPRFLFVALAFPVVLFIIILSIAGHMKIPEGTVVY